MGVVLELDHPGPVIHGTNLLAGRAMINEVIDDPVAPFGGFKMLGLGREFGVIGMQAFTEPRAVFG